MSEMSEKKGFSASVVRNDLTKTTQKDDQGPAASTR
jgi:hypothetical protein